MFAIKWRAAILTLRRVLARSNLRVRIERSAVQVTTCARKRRIQSRISHASIVAKYRVMKRGGWPPAQKLVVSPGKIGGFSFQSLFFGHKVCTSQAHDLVNNDLVKDLV